MISAKYQIPANRGSDDPAVTANADSDETGIVVAGRTEQADIFEDASLKTSSDAGLELRSKCFKYEADRIVVENNNGGDLVGMENN